MLHNSIDMKGLCPATKTEIHRGISNGILWNLRAASFKNNFGELLLKRNQRRRRTRSDPCSFRFSLFPGQLFIYQAMKQCTFSTNFRIVALFNLDYVIHFYKLKKGLSNPVFTITVLAVNIFVSFTCKWVCYNAISQKCEQVNLTN